MRKRRKRFKRQQHIRRRGKYVRKDVEAGPIQFTFKFISGRYGTKDQKRFREEPTSEKVKRWQDKRAELQVLFLMEANFRPGDVFMRLGYPPKTKKSSKAIRADIKAFFKRLRKIFKKKGRLLKYIFSVGRGKRGAIHLHIIINTEESYEVEMAWQETVGTKAYPYPSCNTEHLRADYYWPKVAAYIIKNGLETFRSEDPIYRRRYCASRNLTKPEVKTRIVESSTWTDNPKPPKGYHIDYERMKNGFADTGYPFQSYCAVRDDMAAYLAEIRKAERRAEEMMWREAS